MTPLRPLLAFTLSVALAACSGGNSTDPDPQSANDALRAKLVGTWNMVKGCGGITGGCRTPDQFTEPQTYVFRTDSVEAYRSGQRQWTQNYAIYPGSSSPSQGDTRPVLLIGFGPAVDPIPLRVEFGGDTTLVIDQGCCDRFAFEYRRLKQQ